MPSQRLQASTTLGHTVIVIHKYFSQEGFLKLGVTQFSR